MSSTSLLSDFLRKLSGKFDRRDEPSIDEIIQFVVRGLSGSGGLMSAISPIHSRIANQTVDGPSRWFVPVMTTEAYPRLVSRWDADGKPYHLVVWDERYSHYLARLVEAYEAWAFNPPEMDNAVRAFATIAWDYVLEQLCPENRLPKLSDNPARAERVLGHIFAQRVKARKVDEGLLDTLIHSPTMVDPKVRQLVMLTINFCRQLALDHEAHHYLRRHHQRWNQHVPVSLTELESRVLDSLSGVGNFMNTDVHPSGRIWTYFETILRQVPFNFLREDFEGTPIGEEIQCDLVPLMLFGGEGKDAVQGTTEMQEFKMLSIYYSAGRLWQISSAFLQGLRMEVARTLGFNIRNEVFSDSDIGLRLMLGNYMSYVTMSNPPYADRSPASEDAFDPIITPQMDYSRKLAEVAVGVMNEEPDRLARTHRAFFLDSYELTTHHWLKVLNAVGLEIADQLEVAANPSKPFQAVPNTKSYLKFLRIPTEKE